MKNVHGWTTTLRGAFPAVYDGQMRAQWFQNIRSGYGTSAFEGKADFTRGERKSANDRFC